MITAFARNHRGQRAGTSLNVLTNARERVLEHCTGIFMKGRERIAADAVHQVDASKAERFQHHGAADSSL